MAPWRPAGEGQCVLGQRERWKPSDLRLAALLPVHFLVAWLVPERHWPAVAARMAGVLEKAGAAKLSGRIRTACALAEWRGQSDAIAAELNAHKIEHYFQILRDYRPGGWRPALRIEGREHLEAARARGGVVLWIAHFVHNGLAPKLALHRAGVPVHHMSRAEHGFSKTAFGIRYLNPIRVRIENRYLAGRILIEPEHEERAVRRAAAILSEGGAVSITAGAWEGRRVLLQDCMGGRFPLATGAPAIARLSGATLLPVFALQERRDGATSYVVRIGAPIPTTTGGDRAADVRAACAEYARRLEREASEHPGQWRGWTYLTPPEDAAREAVGGA